MHGQTRGGQQETCMSAPWTKDRKKPVWVPHEHRPECGHTADIQCCTWLISRREGIPHYLYCHCFTKSSFIQIITYTFPSNINKQHSQTVNIFAVYSYKNILLLIFFPKLLSAFILKFLTSFPQNITLKFYTSFPKKHSEVPYVLSTNMKKHCDVFYSPHKHKCSEVQVKTFSNYYTPAFTVVSVSAIFNTQASTSLYHNYTFTHAPKFYNFFSKWHWESQLYSG